jgi:hypothetical protein
MRHTASAWIVDVGSTTPGSTNGSNWSKAITSSSPADETFLGGGYGRVRLVRVKDASAASLHPAIQATVASGSTLTTDFWKGYLGIGGKGYTHSRVNIKGSGLTGPDLLPGVHLIASHLDRWWLGTHHGAMQWRHLDAYLDEFVFRCDRRGSTAGAALLSADGGRGGDGTRAAARHPGRDAVRDQERVRGPLLGVTRVRATMPMTGDTTSETRPQARGWKPRRPAVTPTR